MGWSGQSGLGRMEQGIFNPVEGGEVRERNEMFYGVGMPVQRSDPFEAFRKNKSQGYIQRLRTRDEQRECKTTICLYLTYILTQIFSIFFKKWSDIIFKCKLS